MQLRRLPILEGGRVVPSATAAHRAGAILIIDLAAIAENYRFLQEQAQTAVCAAVVKADAYGLGAEEIVPALAGAGCQHFFVAHLEEGIALRRTLGSGATIAILHGPFAGTEADFIAYDLVPVLNSLDQVNQWLPPGWHLARSYLPSCRSTPAWRGLVSAKPMSVSSSTITSS
jgi:alanine racemase